MFALSTLLEFWNPLTERCGLVLKTGEVIELENTHEDKANNFAFDRSYFDKYDAVATWHTHPKGGPNLSVEDYKVFLSKPDLFHYIIADGIVWGFYVRNNKVFLYEDASVSGLPERPLP